MGLGKGGGATQTWSSQDQPFADFAKTGIMNLKGPASLYGQPTKYETAAGNLLMGKDPLSMDSQNLLGKTLSGDFLDVSGGPYAARNDALASVMQRFLNNNLDTVGASAQRASGGVGSGSAETESTRRAVNEATSNLGETIGRLSAEDLARERGFQTNALNLGFNVPLQRASALGDLGNTLAGRQLAGSTTLIDYILKYLTAARQSPGTPGGGIGDLLAGLGGLGTGVGTLIAASDERVKTDIENIDDELDELMGSLEPKAWRYKWETPDSSKSIGIMAQDLEKTMIGEKLVEEGPHGMKLVNYHNAIPVMMAMIARLATRVKELEGAS